MGIKVKNTSLIEGVYLKKLNEIPVKGGNVLKYINVEDKNFIKFGEVYLSCIDHKYVKGWKKHKIATLNLIVPVGEVKFVLFDDRNCSIGKKLSDNDLIGSPIQIIIGKRDLAEGVIEIKDRILNKSEKVKIDDVKRIVLKKLKP